MPTPNESIRERIVDHVGDALAAITAGASYWYTPASVFRYNLPNVDAMAFPTLVVLDPDEKVERRTQPLAHRTLSLTVVGVHMASLVDSPDRVARRLLADIQKCVLADRTRGGLAVDTHEVANRVVVQGPNEPEVIVEVDFEVMYRTGLGDPGSTS